MDFFEYAELAQVFSNYDTWWVPYLVGGLCYAIVFIFSAVALYTIAVREKYDYKWMAFIPFFNTFYIGYCSRKNKCFNLDPKNISFITAIFELLLVICFILYYAGNALLYSGGYLVEIVEDTSYLGDVQVVSYELARSIPANLGWAAWCFKYLQKYFIWWMQIIYLILDVMILSCFFQTYAARRYFLFTVTSILFPIQGVLFFTVRNNRGMNYREYLQREQERQYRMYQQFQRQNYNPYNNPYDRNSKGNYNPPPADGYTGSSSSADDPFSEFGGDSSPSDSSNSGDSGGDPFDLN